MKKILIVEDEKALAEMYRNKLNNGDFKVFLSSSAEEALEFLKKNSPDLILLDILLPRESGIGLLKKIKKKNKHNTCGIVIFSNYDNPETRKEALSLGVDGYLVKTEFTPGQLLEEIKKFFKTRNNDSKKTSYN